MEYCSALSALNRAENVAEKLDAIISATELDEEIFALVSETFGIIFSAAKEIKNEEFYHLTKNGRKEATDIKSLWQDENGVFGSDFLTLYSDPITPFICGGAAEGDFVTLSTYRKAVSENPSAVLSGGFPEGSGIFNILESDGLNEKGKENYLMICRAADLIFGNAKEKSELAKLVKSALETEENRSLIFENSGLPILYADSAEIQSYYSCTSCIFCRISELSDEKVGIEPLLRSVGMSSGDKICYEEFGEVGMFTFEMNDYK